MRVLNLIFIEPNKRFDRWDLVDRIIHASKILNEVGIDPRLYFMINRGEHIEVLLCTPMGLCSRIHCPKETIGHILSALKCQRPILLVEDGERRYDCVKVCDCIIMGLHSDPYGLIDLSGYVKVSLGNMSYLTSQCILILGYLLASQ